MQAYVSASPTIASLCSPQAYESVLLWRRCIAPAEGPGKLQHRDQNSVSRMVLSSAALVHFTHKLLPSVDSAEGQPCCDWLGPYAVKKACLLYCFLFLPIVSVKPGF